MRIQKHFDSQLKGSFIQLQNHIILRLAGIQIQQLKGTDYWPNWHYFIHNQSTLNLLTNQSSNSSTSPDRSVWFMEKLAERNIKIGCSKEMFDLTKKIFFKNFH